MLQLPAYTRPHLRLRQKKLLLDYPIAEDRVRYFQHFKGNKYKIIDTKGSTKAAFQTGCGTALFVPELSTE
jgi:hypothetical protein